MKNKKPKTTKVVKAKFFQTNQINKDKYNLIVKYAELNRDIKNFISQYVYDNKRLDILLDNFSNFDLRNELKEYRKVFVDESGFSVSATCFQSSCDEVFTRYKTQLNENTTKKLDNCILIKPYLSFLIKYYKNNSDLINLINIRKTELSKTGKLTERAKFYLGLEKLIEKYKQNNLYNRFIQLVLKCRNRLIKGLKQITFESLTFQDKNVLQENKLKNIDGKSLVLNDSLREGNCIFRLNLAGIGKIPLIVKYNRKYHGPLSNYDGSLAGIKESKQRKITYTIKFLKNRKIRIILFSKEESNKYKYDNNSNLILGVDINTSNNLFSLSDGTQISYEEKLYKQAVKLEKTIQRKQKNKQISSFDPEDKTKNDMVYSKKLQSRIDKMSRRCTYYANKKAHELIEYMKNNNYNYLVCEDLNIKGNKTKTKKDGELNYNKIASIFHLNDYKNIFERLCKKENFNFAKVNPRYTSKCCPICGNIDTKNRSHRKFLCTKCGHQDNADINAAINIKDRISNSYLKENLMRFDSEKQIYIGTKHKNKQFYVEIYENKV